MTGVAITPDAAQRWLDHARADREPPRTAVLSMSGRIKKGRWLKFRATEWIDVDRGFVWRARIGPFFARVVGSERFVDGAGSADWALWRLIRVSGSSGEDPTKAGAWRWIADSMAWLPGATEPLHWRKSAEPDVAIAEVHTEPLTEPVRVVLRVRTSGAPSSFSGPRWGKPHGREIAYHRFGMDVTAETTVDDMTVPSEFVSGWGWGETWAQTGLMCRARVTSVRFDAAEAVAKALDKYAKK